MRYLAALNVPRLSLLLLGLCTATSLAADRPRHPASPPLSEEQKITHALNRLAFGSRPSDAARVRKMGLNSWINEQLAPQTIDDSALEVRLAPLTTLQLPAARLLLAYADDNAGFLKQARRQADLKKGDAAEPMKMPLNPRQQRLKAMIAANDLPPQTSTQAIGELMTAKIVRAVESKRQLQEVLVDFWGNHFNLDVKKGTVRALKIVDDRAVTRPHVFGKFRALLGATAHSPAMLVYLDNARSTRAMQAPRGTQKPSRGGINENYARELMELHTLGVDGGYSQQDVQEVARCLTGWTINQASGEFIFRPLLHDNGAKMVLGHAIAAGGGLRDGEAVLDILAAHPATARSIARKLCVRFVADEPPAMLVKKAAKTFLASDGDLREVVKTIVTAPEFYAPQVLRAKIKSPFEYVVSTLRALDVKLTVPDPAQPRGRLRLVADGLSVSRPNAGAQNPRKWQMRQSAAQQIAAMGQPLFSCRQPTGYSENSRQWVSSGALIARLNFALAVTSGGVDGVQVALPAVLGGVDGDNRAAIFARLARVLLGGELSAATRATLEKQTADEAPLNVAKLTALLLGSPEFQRR